MSDVSSRPQLIQLHFWIFVIGQHGDVSNFLLNKIIKALLIDYIEYHRNALKGEIQRI